MSKIPPPPVPQKLREMFKDYPEHIDRLQEVLDYVVETSSDGVDPFERAIWALESRLEAFMAEASAELRAAEEDGDMHAVQKAKVERSVMGSARMNMGGMSDLMDYFNRHQGALK